MSSDEWSIIVGVVVSALLALGPWMFMVHAKLAVLASQVEILCKKVDRANEAHDKLWAMYAHHEAKLETHEVRISQISERLRDFVK